MLQVVLIAILAAFSCVYAQGPKRITADQLLNAGLPVSPQGDVDLGAFMELSTKTSPLSQKLFNVITTTSVSNTPLDLIKCTGFNETLDCIVRESGGCRPYEQVCMCSNLNRVYNKCFETRKITADNDNPFCGGSDAVRRREQIREEAIRSCVRQGLPVDSFSSNSVSLLRRISWFSFLGSLVIFV